MEAEAYSQREYAHIKFLEEKADFQENEEEMMSEREILEARGELRW